MAVRSLTVKERILLHLFDFNRYENDYTVPLDVTQKGIADATGIRVHHVTQNTRPLILDDFVREQTRHIEGRPRRQKAYFLTHRGKSRAASLRSSLLGATVSVKATTGEMEEVPLSAAIQERRRGSTLLQLLEELSSVGYITEQAKRPDDTETVDFSQDAPEVELFYGREKELKEVQKGLKEAPVVVVTGIAGIGKSALGSKICERAKGMRPVFWERIRPWTAPSDLARNLGRFLKGGGRGRLNSLMRRSTSQEMGRTEEALAMDLAGFGGLLVFDDVHIASEETQAFLSMLYGALKRNEGNSALLLTRERPPFYSRRDVKMEDSVREVSLGVLDRESSEALLLDEGVHKSKTRDLSRVSGGSPLFLRILARARTQEEIRAGLATLEDYIAEEIEPTLDNEERAVMQLGSLFEVPVPARALLQEARGGTGVILSLHRKGLFDKAEARRFSLHDALRAYFRGGLHPDRSRALAEKAAPWLLEEAERIARHGNLWMAISYAENAVSIEPSRRGKLRARERLGDLRLLIHDHAGAERAYRRALEETEDTPKMAMLHFKIGSVLENQGRLDQEEEVVDAGLRLLPESPSREAAWLLWMKAEIARWRREYDKAIAGYEEIWNWLADMPEELTLKASIANWRGLMKLYDPVGRDPVAAKNLVELGFEAAQTDPNRDRFTRDDPLPQAHLFKAVACLHMGEIQEALRHIDEASELYGKIGAPASRLWILSLRAWCLGECLGQPEEATRMYEEAHRIARETANDLRELWLYRGLADLYRSQSRYFEARESQEHFLLTCSDLVTGDNRIEGLALMVRLCILCGDSSGARSYLEEAESLAQPPSDVAKFYLSWAEAVLEASQMKASKARASFENALTIGPMCPWPMIFPEFLATHAYRGEFLLDYGRFLSSLGEPGEAEPILLQAKNEFTKFGRKPLVSEVERLLQSLPDNS